MEYHLQGQADVSRLGRAYYLRQSFLDILVLEISLALNGTQHVGSNVYLVSNVDDYISTGIKYLRLEDVLNRTP